jgi:pyruvate,orthophosphate dikinase
VPYVYAFSHKHKRPPMEYKDLLGGKGANLAEMTSVLKLPVPPGFTISTDACRAYMHSGWPAELDEEIAQHVFKLEKAMGRKLGDPYDPLLVSVRSGAKFSMPGMMDTVLNLGLNDESVKGLAHVTDDERFAYDSYRRFISMYARIVQGLDGAIFEHPLEAAKAKAGVKSDAELSADVLKGLCQQYLAAVQKETGKPFPQKPREQLRGAVEAVFKSWNGARAIAYRVREKISHDLGTAVNVQTMVFGNRDENSGTGVGFTRNAATGENVPYGDFLINAQGEDVVAGIRNTEDLDHLGKHFPEIKKELLDIFKRLEAHYQDMCDTEFTIEQGKLWMLQTRVGKRTGAAALKMAVDMTKGTKSPNGVWKISKEEAVMRVAAEHLDSGAAPAVRRQGQGAGQGPRRVAGRRGRQGVLHRRRRLRRRRARRARGAGPQRDQPRRRARHDGQSGHPHGRGGLVSHAAVVARGWGTPAVVGAEAIKIDGQDLHRRRRHVKEGDIISIDGTTGEVILGELKLAAAKPPAEFDVILKWADVRSARASWACAPTPTPVRTPPRPASSAPRASACAAPSTCSWRPIAAGGARDDPRQHRRRGGAGARQPRQGAAGRLRGDPRGDGRPARHRASARPAAARVPALGRGAAHQAGDRQAHQEEQAELRAAEEWAEHNPMIGTRGVRLGVVKPGLYAMQVRALMAAAAALRAKGKNPIVEVMIPLTVTREELALARGWVQTEIDAAVKGMKKKPKVTIGTMIETPRAAVRADQIAEEADFFSFGTNDLTQMTFGFSRDDVESKMMPAYLEQGLLKRNPFETIDQSTASASSCASVPSVAVRPSRA